MRLVGMEHDGVPMLQPEFLPGKVLHRRQNLLWRCPRWHRKHELVNQLRRPSRPRLEVGLAPMLFQIQIPVFEQLLLDTFARQSLTVVGLDIHFSPSIQIAEMTTDRFEVLPSPAEHFDHDLRSSGYRARDQLDLVLRQAVSPTRAPAGITGDIEEGLGPSDINESSRHAPSPRRAD